MGTRFRNVSSKPKILAPFKSGCFLDWLVKYSDSHGFTNLTLSLGYKAEEVMQYVENQIKFKHKKINYCIESTPLGTGGAIKNFIDKFDPEETIVLNGDTFWPGKIPAQFIQARTANAICLTSQVRYNDRFGEFKVVNGKLQIHRGSTNKPLRSSDSFVGICKINKNIKFSGLRLPFSLEELLMQQTSGVELYKSDFKFFDFGTAQAYRDLLKSTNDS